LALQQHGGSLDFAHLLQQLCLHLQHNPKTNQLLEVTKAPNFPFYKTFELWIIYKNNIANKPYLGKKLAHEWIYYYNFKFQKQNHNAIVFWLKKIKKK
jgi:hypothetical protein